MFYDLAKTAVNRLAFAHGHELAAVRRHRGRGDAGMAAFGDDARQLGRRREPTGAARWIRTAVAGCPPRRPSFADSESPRFVGRGVAAIAADDDRARWNQRSVTSADLAREYGFTDIDGRQPDGWT